MSFQHPPPGLSGSGSGDVQSRRSILQGLQQTKTRLQRMHSEEQSSRSSPGHYVSSHRAPGRPPHTSQPSSIPHPQSLMSVPKSMNMATPSPSEQSALIQQQKSAMQQAQSHSFGYFVPQSSFSGNAILPVLPRFNSSGELVII